MNHADLDPRDILLSGFRAALDRVNGAAAVRRALQDRALSFTGDVDLIAVGKAASAMASGAQAALGDRLRQGLVITKHRHFGHRFDQRFQCIESDHPIPGAASLAAGVALLEFCQRIPKRQGVLVCFSGGASSLIEVLPSGVTLQSLADMNRRLLGEGLDIAAMNRFRRSVSRIKNGRLATQLEGRPVDVLLISDVPGDDPAIIGSGPLYPPTREQDGLGRQLEVNQNLSVLPESPPASLFEQISHRIVANLEMAKQAAVVLAEQQGLPVCIRSEFLDGEVSMVGQQIEQYLQSAPAGLHVWGGEPVVTLPENPGRGGRNQHLALLLAQQFRGRKDLTILVAGSDGTDGPTDDAGGLIDGESCQRGERKGLVVAQALARFDAGTFLEASGDLVSTGPTGTNVMDLVMAFKRAGS